MKAERPGLPAFLTQHQAGLIILLESLLAILLGLHTLDAKSLWLDEAFSISNATDLPGMLGTESNGWMYYVLLRIWFVFGQSEIALRSLSVLFAAATVSAAYVLGRDLFDRRVGLVVGLLVAVHPLFVEYAQEARGYAMLMCEVTILSVVFLRAVRQTGSGWWMLYGLLGAISWYTHFFSGLLILAHMTSLVVMRRSRLPWAGLFTAGGVGGVLLIPWVVFRPVSARGLQWLPATTLHDLVALMVSFTGGSRLLLLLLAMMILVSLVTLVRSAPRRHTEGAGVITVVIWIALPIGIAFLFSLLVQPIFLSRYLMVSLVPFLLLVGYAIVSLRPAPVSWVAGAIVLVFFVRTLVTWYGENDRKEEWRQVTASILRQAQPGDVVVFYAYVVRTPFEYYFNRMNGPATGLQLFDISSGPVGKVKGRTSDLPDPDIHLLDSLAAPPGRVWLVLAHNDLVRLGRDRESAFIEGHLNTLLPHRVTEEYSQVKVICYGP